MLKKLLSSFDNSTTGFSARKLSAFWGVLAVSYIIYKDVLCEHVSEEIKYIIAIILLFVLLCLSIITFEQVIKLKNGSNVQPPKPDGV